jgi:hypothetical protein
MDKLRHIHSKVGSETAYRIPVSVEDAIAEAVEAYDLMRMAAEAEAKRSDELSAQTKFITAAFKEVLDTVDDDSKHYYLNIINSAPAQSHNAIQAKALRDVAYKLTFPPIIHDIFSKGYDCAISDIREAADALEGEGDDV